MATDTEKTLVTTIEALAKRVKDVTRPDDALKLTQSALNLAHTISVLSHK